MRPKDRNLVIIGVFICFLIALLAPFIASPNPDGLEKSAEQISTTEEGGIFQAPLPDYTIEPLGKIGDIVALVLGIIVTLAISYLVAILIRRKIPPKSV
jgi:cobalt/nickel transport protein